MSEKAVKCEECGLTKTLVFNENGKRIVCLNCIIKKNSNIEIKYSVELKHLKKLIHRCKGNEFECGTCRFIDDCDIIKTFVGE